MLKIGELQKEKKANMDMWKHWVYIISTFKNFTIQIMLLSAIVSLSMSLVVASPILGYSFSHTNYIWLCTTCP